MVKGDVDVIYKDAGTREENFKFVDEIFKEIRFLQLFRDMSLAPSYNFSKSLLSVLRNSKKVCRTTCVCIVKQNFENV